MSCKLYHKDDTIKTATNKRHMIVMQVDVTRYEAARCTCMSETGGNKVIQINCGWRFMGFELILLINFRSSRVWRAFSSEWYALSLESHQLHGYDLWCKPNLWFLKQTSAVQKLEKTIKVYQNKRQMYALYKLKICLSQRGYLFLITQLRHNLRHIILIADTDWLCIAAAFKFYSFAIHPWSTFRY